MKFLKPILIGLLVVIILLFVGVAIFIKTLDVDKIKNDIAKKISDSIGREVAIEKLSFHFDAPRNLTLKIRNLSIYESAELKSAPLAVIESIDSTLDLGTFMKKRQILISNIDIKSPRIDVVKNGVVPFTGKEISDIKDLSATQLRLQIPNFSLNQSVPFKLDFALLSEKQNIHLKGVVTTFEEKETVRLDEFHITTNLSELSLNDLKNSMPSLNDIPLTESLQGHFEIIIEQMVVGHEGILLLSAHGNLREGRVAIDYLTNPLEQVQMHFTISESDININTFDLSLGQGTMSGKARIQDYSGEQKISVNMDIKEIPAEMIKIPDVDMTIYGKISGQMSGQGKGLSESMLTETFKGDGIISMQDGRIADVNILKTVLSKITFVPGLAEKVENNLPEKYKQKLKNNDTILEEVQLKIEIQNGLMTYQPLTINADGFILTSNGSVDKESNLKFNGHMVIPEDLSSSMIETVEELLPLSDSNNQIRIPFRSYQGKIKDFVPYPDIEDVAKEALKNRGKDELKDLIFKALDIEEEKIETQNGEDPSADSQEQQEERPEQILIENVLDSLFKKLD